MRVAMPVEGLTFDSGSGKWMRGRHKLWAVAVVSVAAFPPIHLTLCLSLRSIQSTCAFMAVPNLPTRAALLDVDASGAQHVSLGLPGLDILLSPSVPLGAHGSGGLPRGHVAEIYGPPGSGKTAMCMQACASVLNAGDHVVWVSGLRLKQVVQSSEHFRESEELDVLTNMHHFSSPTLAHLLALLAHSTPAFPPKSTTLVVVESAATLIDLAYPRNLDDRSENARWTSSRRQTITGELARNLTRLAAVRNVAVMLTTHATTRLRGEAAAVLRPAITNIEWDNAMAHKIVLYRDWAEDSPEAQDRSPKSSARFASISKSVAFRTHSQAQRLVAFDIVQAGLVELPKMHRRAYSSQSDVPSGVKRPSSALDSDESSDNEYGWAEDDDHLAAEGLVGGLNFVSALSSTTAPTRGQDT
ncbi:hypothetical protein FH972_026661 [Carpinus fangiana]|uniref:RecA family profile 1 domain-containing protein n=1 Tax=Carpinus fangiana TaxID=176857 RepID=A0A5N6L4M7_9ROSI|nr:hypothetical protein FH972_026661 [Carpinus fangiana]